MKIPSGCEWVSATRAKPVKTPFDFVFCKGGVSIFCDAKTTNDKNFSYGKIVRHQLFWLEAIYKTNNVAGYIVNFRESNQTVFFSADKLAGLRPRCSLAPIDGIILGDNHAVDLDLLAVKNVLHEKP